MLEQMNKILGEEEFGGGESSESLYLPIHDNPAFGLVSQSKSTGYGD